MDGLVNEDVIRLLIDALPVGQKLCVCGTAIDPAARDALRELRPGSTMRKVPAALLDEYRMTTRHRGELASRLDWSAAEALLNAPADADATAGA